MRTSFPSTSCRAENPPSDTLQSGPSRSHCRNRPSNTPPDPGWSPTKRRAIFRASCSPLHRRPRSSPRRPTHSLSPRLRTHAGRNSCFRGCHTRWLPGSGTLQSPPGRQTAHRYSGSCPKKLSVNSQASSPRTGPSPRHSPSHRSVPHPWHRLPETQSTAARRCTQAPRCPLPRTRHQQPDTPLSRRSRQTLSLCPHSTL